MPTKVFHPIQFLDGVLTESEEQQIMEDVRAKKDFLIPEKYKEIYDKDEAHFERVTYIGQEPRPMTKREFVQCWLYNNL